MELSLKDDSPVAEGKLKSVYGLYFFFFSVFFGWPDPETDQTDPESRGARVLPSQLRISSGCAWQKQSGEVCGHGLLSLT